VRAAAAFGNYSLGPILLLLSCCGGGSNQTTVVAPMTINVLNNSYGISLIADGVTDNCAAWAKFQAAVPDYSIAYFPLGRYYVNPAVCPFGFVLTKHLSISGESSGDWDGSNINNATVFLSTVNLNMQAGTFVRSIAVDARNGVLDANDGVSSGAAAVSAGNTTVEDVLYVGSAANWFAHPVHAILLQSGPNNSVENVRVYYAFHAVAIRATNTNVSDVKTWDAVDVIVKSDAGSGNADKNTLNGLVFDGEAGQAGGLFFTAQSIGFETAADSASNISCHNSAYCVVFEVDSGGQMQDIAVSNVAAQDSENGVYAYAGDGNPSNSMSNISVIGVGLSNLSGNGIQNNFASSFCVGDFTYNAIGGAPVVGVVGTC
jgi:hypothetical protein